MRHNFESMRNETLYATKLASISHDFSIYGTLQ